MLDFGRLERVNVRDAWPHESHNFTPWLSQNLDRLTAELGIESLELEGTEVSVGPYRADIIARVPQDGSRVLIENQLERSNLQHLGQVLAYLAGLKSEIVIWVATGFEEAHLSAIRWLNDHTTDPFAFFAVRVNIVRIGDSKLAPVFDVIERPNGWNRRVEEITKDSLSSIGQFRRDFWAHFASVLPDAPTLRPGYAGSNIYHRVEAASLDISLYIAQSGVGVYLTGKNGVKTPDVNHRIRLYTDALADALEKDKHEGEKSSSTWARLPIDATDRDNWTMMAHWLDNRRSTYEQVLLNDPATDRC